MIEGVVIKGVASRFTTDTEEGIKECFARGKLKKDGDIRVGDRVLIQKEGKDFVITKVLERKNRLIRPYVANVDLCFIVIAPVPAPDFMLVDKIIVNARMNGITPVIIVNKTDIADERFLNGVENDYNNVAKVLRTSALTGLNKDVILELSKGKTACLAGQSAVGKSSLMNALLGADKQETGGLSKKTERGRHTTRQSEILKIGDARIIDTCGFSMLELPEDFRPQDLVYYYDEFADYAFGCRFRTGCTHVSEPDCAVRKAVNENKISKNRYERYCVLYSELKEKWRKRYE